MESKFIFIWDDSLRARLEKYKKKMGFKCLAVALRYAINQEMMRFEREVK